MGVGADGAACSNHLDCLQEVRLAPLEEIYRESSRCLADLIRRSGLDL